MILTPLPSLVPVPVLVPVGGAPDVGPAAVAARAARDVLDVSAGGLVGPVASQDRVSVRNPACGRGRGGRVPLRGRRHV